MEEPSATTEVSTSRDLSTEIKSFGNEFSFGSSKDTIGVSIPVCYLIKEQAKAHIAIQELQKRLTHVENVQDDVVDAIIEFRNHFCDTKSFCSANPLMTSNSLSTTRSPSVIFPKLNSVSKSKENYVPSATDSSVEVPQSILKTRSYSSKDCDHKFSDYGKSQAIAGVPELSQKQLDLIKSKDSALESDKQDSGLDSDCREIHEIQQSIGKCIPSSANQDSNDELLQLLDEIGYRSTVLQKQLAIAEEVTTLADLKEMTARSRNGKSDIRNSNCSDSKLSEASRNGLMQDHRQQSRLVPPAGEDGRFYAEEKVPIALKPNGSIAGLFEGKPLCDRRPSRKKAANSIDSSVVSSILKETNVVDLQRQALIYLVDNAVLNTKLREAEQSLSSKHVESEKIENALKEEARLLMMENRELRISLDEQRMENTSLKSRLVMLEKVVQSVSNENQELNWQLSESLNLQNFPKRGSLNYSTSFRSENPVGASRSGRRFSHPVNPAPFHNDRNINCVRSKLLSNNSSFLDVNVEDSATDSTANFGSSAALRFRNKPVYSSTPMPSQRQKEIDPCLSKSPNLSDMSPANFHSVKKCLKTSYASSDQASASHKVPKSSTTAARCPEESYTSNIPETYANKCPQSDDTLPLEGAGKFPFNTILEKLKSNSEYRLSKSASAKSGELSSDNSEPSRAKSPVVVNSSKAGSAQGGGNNSHFKEAKFSQETSADVILQRKKGRNIQQRIQNILDRIVAESEEAS